MRTISAELRVDSRGNLVVAEGLEAAVEHILQRVRFTRGEWFLDNLAGVPYFEEIFGQPYQEGLAARVIATEVEGLEDVNSVEVVSSSLAEDRRSLHLVLRVNTSFGEVIVEEDI